MSFIPSFFTTVTYLAIISLQIPKLSILRANHFELQSFLYDKFPSTYLNMVLLLFKHGSYKGIPHNYVGL